MTVAGVDEAGRGPLAGPVVAAAAVLTRDQARELMALGLKDSKALSPRRREALFEAIRSLNVQWRAQAASWGRIDRTHVLKASLWAMGMAVMALPVRPQLVLVDGSVPIEGLRIPQRCVVKGDSKVPSIMAASVIAKVLRDRVMLALDRLYPQYRFSSHKGYPTEEHRRILSQLGPSPVHRRSFSFRRI